MSEKTVRWATPQGGWTAVPNRVLADAKLSRDARLTFAVLAMYAFRDESVWPGQERVAGQLGTTDRTMRRYTTELARAKLITVIQRGNKETNIYILHPEQRYGSDRTPASVHDRTRASDHDRTPASDKEDVGRKNTEELSLSLEEHSDTPSVSIRKGASVDKHKVTAEEWTTATAALAVFNAANGTEFGATTSRGDPSPHIKPIIMRIREHPELDAEDHARIVREAFERPYWTGNAKVTNIYGPRAFEHCVGGTRPNDQRRFQDERRTRPGEGPGW